MMRNMRNETKTTPLRTWKRYKDNRNMTTETITKLNDGKNIALKKSRVKNKNQGRCKSIEEKNEEKII